MRIIVREARGDNDIASARQLMRDYGDHLANNPSGAANICLTGYEQELERLPQGYAAILLAEVDGAPAACVALREIVRDEQACEMKRLWVGSGFRGLGLGRLLIQEALNWAEQHGFQAMYLDTVPAAMPEASRLYASLGFLPVERYNENPVAGVEFFRKQIANV